jgi:hypothetical protein
MTWIAQTDTLQVLRYRAVQAVLSQATDEQLSRRLICSSTPWAVQHQGEEIR